MNSNENRTSPTDREGALSAAVKRRKMRYSWHMAIVVVVVYFGYIGLLAFGATPLAQPLIGDGLFSIGMALGLATTLAAIGATALYALRINRIEAEARDQSEENGGQSL